MTVAAAGLTITDGGEAPGSEEEEDPSIITCEKCGAKASLDGKHITGVGVGYDASVCEKCDDESSSSDVVYAPEHWKVRFTMEIWDEDGMECERQEFVLTVKQIAEYEFDLDNNCVAFYDGQEDFEGFDAWVEARFSSNFDWSNTGDMNVEWNFVSEGPAPTTSPERHFWSADGGVVEVFTATLRWVKEQHFGEWGELLSFADRRTPVDTEAQADGAIISGDSDDEVDTFWIAGDGSLEFITATLSWVRGQDFDEWGGLVSFTDRRTPPAAAPSTAPTTAPTTAPSTAQSTAPTTAQSTAPTPAPPGVGAASGTDNEAAAGAGDQSSDDDDGNPLHGTDTPCHYLYGDRFTASYSPTPGTTLINVYHGTMAGGGEHWWHYLAPFPNADGAAGGGRPPNGLY